MSKPYSRPILSSIFDILGGLVLIGAGITILGGFVSEGERYLIGAGIAGVVIAIFYFEIAQVIDFLGRTAHNTERLCTLLDSRGPVDSAPLATRKASAESGSPETASEKTIPLQPYEDPFEKWQREQRQKQTPPENPPKT